MLKQLEVEHQSLAISLHGILEKVGDAVHHLLLSLFRFTMKLLPPFLLFLAEALRKRELDGVNPSAILYKCLD